MDLLTPLMKWVESGFAPGKIVTSHSADTRDVEGPPVAPGLRPPTPGPVDRTRPIFPYPEQAKYTGDGSIDSEANFVPESSLGVSADRLHWMGSSFYNPGYEIWCTDDASGQHCSSEKNAFVNTRARPSLHLAGPGY